MMSNEFSNNFSNEQYYGNTNTAMRMDSHKSISEYQSGLKSSQGKIVIEDCGELNQQNFYDYILKYSIFHHFWDLENERDFAAFSELKLKQILNYLGDEWGLYV